MFLLRCISFILLFSFSILLFTAIFTPFRIAFYDIDSSEWIIIDGVIDAAFFIDIIFNFITAYYDYSDNLVISKKRIAFHYIKTWFFVDLLAP